MLTINNPFQRINHLIDLKDNWDGYGAIRFSQEQVDKALSIYTLVQDFCITKGLDLAHVQPFIAPCSNGNVLFNWDGAQFKDKELELCVPNDVNNLFTYLKTESENEEEGECDLSGINNLLNWLFYD